MCVVHVFLIYNSYLDKYRVDDPGSEMGGEQDRLAEDEVEAGPPPLQVQEPHRDQGRQEAPGEPVLGSSPHTHLDSAQFTGVNRGITLGVRVGKNKEKYSRTYK